MPTRHGSTVLASLARRLRGLPGLYVGFLIFAGSAAAIAGATLKLASGPLPGPLNLVTPASASAGVTTAPAPSTTVPSYLAQRHGGSPLPTASGAVSATASNQVLTPAATPETATRTSVSTTPTTSQETPEVVQPSQAVVQVAPQSSPPTTGATSDVGAGTASPTTTAKSSSGDSASKSQDQSATTTTSNPATSSPESSSSTTTLAKPSSGDN